MTGFLDFLLRLLAQHEHRAQADHQGEQQHREDCQGQDFGLQAQAHSGLTLGFIA